MSSQIASELILGDPKRQVSARDDGRASSSEIEAAEAAYARYVETWDNAYLDNAIRLFQHAVDAANKMDPNLPGWLGHCLAQRFAARGKLDDLERAIAAEQHALRLVSDEHPDKPQYLNNLACSWKKRFAYLGTLDDLETAIQMQRLAVELTPTGHSEDMEVHLGNLADLHQLRYERLGDPTDLENAVAGRQRGVELIPEEHSHMPLCLNNLAASLRSRFERLGELHDLESAIKMQRRAIVLTTKGSHSDTASRLANLGRLQHLRFERLGDLQDLEHAIMSERRAVNLTPDEHPDMPILLNNLAVSVRSRYERLGELDDLEDVIKMQRRAIELTPDAHPNLAMWVDHLAFSQQLRYLRVEDLDDLEHAIAGQQRAVGLTPDGHADMPMRLNNLGYTLHTRFKRLGDVVELDRAITALRRAVELAPDAYPNKPKCLLNLGRSHASYLTLHRTLDSFNEAVSCLMAVLDRQMGALSTRLQAAQLAVELHRDYPEYSAPEKHLRAFASILDMLPEIIWLGHSLTRRLEESRQLRGMSNSAVRVAIETGALAQAVEWLDAGRSFIWSQVLSLRSPVDGLARHHPDLARSFERINAQLQGTVSASSLHQSVPPVASAHDLAAMITDTEADRHRGLAIEYGRILADVRRQPGFEHFMKPKKLEALFPSSAPLHGFIVFVNVDRASCHAVILSSGKRISTVSLPKLSLDKADALRLQWQSYLQQHNVRERGMIARRRHHSSRNPVVNILRCIWEWIVRPILNALRLPNELKSDDDHLPHVTWCPSGPLTQLPLHAAGLYDDESGPRVYDYAISSYTPSLSALTRSVDAVAKQRIDPSVLVVTQPDTPGLLPLPGTIVEGEFLQRVLSQSQVLHSGFNGQQASRATVRADLDNHPWLHLACHGSQDLEDPMQSAFALFDGPLSLTDLMSTTSDNAELAFLSACQTAVGDEKIPEESMHLAAGMLAVGFKGVIATMWSIRDDDAPLVVETYYRKLLKLRASGTLQKGETGAAYALHEATKRLREEVGEKEFVRWAPFVHFGI